MASERGSRSRFAAAIISPAESDESEKGAAASKNGSSPDSTKKARQAAHSAF